ncbi:MAG: hypothetical protein WBC68_10485 [Albidovulum sp.]
MELILHLGAHRTGSTALQQMLQRRVPVLEAEGLRFWGPEIMRIGRLRDFVPTVARLGDALKLPGSLAQMGAALHQEFDLAEAEGARRLVVSDENLLGAIHDTYSTVSLYPNAQEWLVAAAGLFPRCPEHIYLCVRDYAAFSVSLYSHLVSRLHLPPFDPDRIESIGKDRGWPSVLAEVRTVFPKSRLHVWRYGRDARMVPGAGRAMLGEGAALVQPRLNVNAGLSGIAVAAINALWDECVGQPTATVKQKADALRKLAGPKFDPFTQDQRGRMSARFEADWNAIVAGAVEGVEVFDPVALEAVR